MLTGNVTIDGEGHFAEPSVDTMIVPFRRGAELTLRRMTAEKMDDPALRAEDHVRALRGLARINGWTGCAGLLWSIIRNEAKSRGRPIRILDVATGSGDIPISLAKRSRAEGIPIVIAGCDISPVAIEMAKSRARTLNVAVEFFPLDVLRHSLPTGYDIMIASLFLHHLTNQDAVRVLNEMARAAGRMVVVNDLARSRWNYLLTWLGCQFLSRSPVVHFDGPVSVNAAFTPREVVALAHQAGLSDCLVRKRFPCRWILTWKKSS